MTIISDLISLCAALHRPEELSVEGYHRQTRDHIASLQSSTWSQAIRSVVLEEGLLDNFDPSTDSAIYLIILYLKIETISKSTRQLPVDLAPSGELWLRASHFFATFDPIQVRYLGNEWRQLIGLIAQSAQANSKPLLAAQIIRDALLRLDPSSAVVSSTHLLLVRLCLQAQAYTCALPVLDKHITQIPLLTATAPPTSSIFHAKDKSSLAFINEATGLSAKMKIRDNMQYFLYGGMVFMALKQWQKASYFLGNAFSIKTHGTMSKIQVEAYKKWILVSLLESGSRREPPVSITSQHLENLQFHAKPYIDFAQAFISSDYKKVEAQVQASQDLWTADYNMGLINQVLVAFKKYSLIKINKTFAALTVSEISEQLSWLPDDPKGAESSIASLIMSGALNAVLVHRPMADTMVRFINETTSPRLSHEIETQDRFKGESQSLEALMRGLTEINHSLGLSDAYVDGLETSQHMEEDRAMTTMTNIGTDIEEDLMVDFS
ncbi:hypothetical protein N7495_008865 [Penicillium taxi]|uniref:uncharacterized protein n=1 Tax=Penicillium taxi TaxID=168475 RepID=UPI002545554B|nr:uncharacterized protein N7495_008865 [Penicillium taxi]KAJ5888824.1 hypothetical protein N7495_008865 [Penicillium taxi]